ncbi:unnamed protein product [Parnassius apollo]|uniref:(apollo) hypothetical protein n=1 Tax=Parnassius apollo TaxID=110799 RepID=A0A8S3WZ33_PARAO|nr:unnamed protein product [Parnassius apollo]
MTVQIKEKLIELVRQHECLYDYRHKEYKNNIHKTLVWDRIGRALNIEVSKAKDIWRALRDGYVRHKKEVKGQSGSKRKYCHYMWSEQMAFLDESLALRPTNTIITSPQIKSEQPQSPTFLEVSISQQSPNSPDEEPYSVALWRSSAQPGPSWAEPKQQLHQISDFNSFTQSPLLPHTQPQSSPSSSISTSVPNLDDSSIVQKRKNSNSDENKSSEVLEFLRNRRIDYDAVDHLFMSYAKTFKKLTARKQIELKKALANLFADAELSELDSEFPREEQ